MRKIVIHWRWRHGKILLLTLDEQEEKIIDKIIAALADCLPLETMQTVSASVLSFPIPALSLQGHKYLKPFGTWRVILAIQALVT